MLGKLARKFQKFESKYQPTDAPKGWLHTLHTLPFFAAMTAGMLGGAAGGVVGFSMGIKSSGILVGLGSAVMGAGIGAAASAVSAVGICAGLYISVLSVEALRQKISPSYRRKRQAEQNAQAQKISQIVSQISMSHKPLNKNMQQSFSASQKKQGDLPPAKNTPKPPKPPKR